MIIDNFKCEILKQIYDNDGKCYYKNVKEYERDNIKFIDVVNELVQYNYITFYYPCYETDSIIALLSDKAIKIAEDYIRANKSLSFQEDAVILSKEANKLSDDANFISIKSLKTARIAIVISIISVLVTIGLAIWNVILLTK